MLSLKAGGKGLVLPSLMCQVLLTPLGVEVEGRWALGEARKVQGGMKWRTVIRM